MLIRKCTWILSSTSYSILSVLRSCKSAPHAYIIDQNVMKTVEVLMKVDLKESWCEGMS